MLSADVVTAIDDLELAARLVVEGLRAGSHRSPFHGYSSEFQQHRPYRAGDDLKYLDWKLLARTEGFLVDPIYTAKGLAELIARVRDGRLSGPVVFCHAGGTPGLFETLPE